MLRSAARTAHIILGESAISNGDSSDIGITAEEQRIERFCDAAAAAGPPGHVVSQCRRGGERPWSDDELRIVANAVDVSREALLLRFPALKRATWDFCDTQRARFESEYLAATERTAGTKRPMRSSARSC